MRGYHGTDAALADVIRRDGLRSPAGRPVFLADRRETALRYAKARAAGAGAQGQEPIGLVVIVEIDLAQLSLDPFDPREPGQWCAAQVAPAAIVELESIRFRWSWPSAERGRALADHVALERVRAAGRDVWAPATLMDLAADVALIRSYSRRRANLKGRRSA